MPPRIVAADFETTGCSQYHDEVFNIGATDGTTTLDLYINNIDGTPLKPLPEEVERLTGMTNEQLQALDRASSRRKEQFERFMCYLSGDGTPTELVFHNGKSFDTYFLVRALHAEGLQLPTNVTHITDSMLWARHDLKLGCRNDLETLAQFLGVQDLRNGAHRALVDSQMLLGVVEKMQTYGPCPQKRKEVPNECFHRVLTKCYPPPANPPPKFPSLPDIHGPDMPFAHLHALLQHQRRQLEAKDRYIRQLEARIEGLAQHATHNRHGFDLVAAVVPSAGMEHTPC